MKAYPQPNLSAVAPLDAHTADATAEQTQFDQTLERREKMICSAQEARSAPIKSQFIKNLPPWQRAKLLKQPENTTVEKTSPLQDNSCQFIISETDDSVIDALTEMVPSGTDTLVSALRKLSEIQGAMDVRLNEMSKR